MKITCGKLVSGEICYGNLVETGETDDNILLFEGKKYRLIE
jgi:hypothetical protein